MRVLLDHIANMRFDARRIDLAPDLERPQTGARCQGASQTPAELQKPARRRSPVFVVAKLGSNQKVFQVSSV